MSRYPILLTEDAERDLEEIYTHIAETDSAANAERVLEGLLKADDGLATRPDRGTQPKELRALGIQDYRQVFFKPYRVIYRQLDERVVILVIANSRRDMQSLLSRRLLRQAAHTCVIKRRTPAFAKCR